MFTRSIIYRGATSFERAIAVPAARNFGGQGMAKKFSTVASSKIANRLSKHPLHAIPFKRSHTDMESVLIVRSQWVHLFKNKDDGLSLEGLTPREEPIMIDLNQTEVEEYDSKVKMGEEEAAKYVTELARKFEKGYFTQDKEWLARIWRPIFDS